MSLPFNILIILIAAVPVMTLTGSALAMPFLMVAVAIGLISIAISSRAGDASHFERATSGVLWLFASIPFFILLQLLPLPMTLSNPIWASAAEALQTKMAGHTTMDIGATIAALVAVSATISLVWLTITVARDRRRAELLLLASSAVVSLSALANVIQLMVPSNGPVAAFGPSPTLNVFGIILNLATVLLIIERQETRHGAISRCIVASAAAIAGAGINGIALYVAVGIPGGAAAAVGVTLFALVIIIRRLDLGRWPTVVICTIALVGSMIVLGYLADQNAAAHGLLRFGPAQSAEQMAICQRMLEDIRWLGSGAGTFDVIGRIYQTSVSEGSLTTPTAAVAIAIEIGWIGLVGVFVIGTALAIKLFRGALRRGRDSFFSAAAAACVLAGLFDLVIGTGLLQPPAATLLAIIVGIGIAQNFSQTVRQ